VTAWTGDRETNASSKEERLRRLVDGSIKLCELLRAGRVATGGPAATVLGENLEKMRAMLG
jgi:hypothetical protein